MATIAEALTAALEHHRAGRLPEAEEIYRRILSVEPEQAEALHYLGVIAYQAGKLEHAAEFLARAIRANPGAAAYHHHFGLVRAAQGRTDEAIASFQRALALAPDLAEAHNSLGNALKDQDRIPEAISCYRRALELRPELSEAYINLGNTLELVGRRVQAADCYRKALALKPENADAHWNCALLLLLQGEFERGWQEYEWRWATRWFARRGYAQPRWKGEPLPGGTLLLHFEQGLGDTIQFARYAPLVKARVGTVILECQRSLLRLLSGVSGVDRLVAEGDTLPAFDAWTPLLSLPRVFGTTLANIPSAPSYFVPDAALAARWREKLAGIEGFTIGIGWQGNVRFRRDRQRSIPLAAFEGLARLPGVRLVSLQKGPGTEQLEELRGRLPVLDFPELDEASGPFMDTAAILTCLDLVVTSDTALAHLAGALGVPVWVALPYAPDWRWLLERKDSPWYPSMRLFRQARPGDWAGVFERIEAAIRERTLELRPRFAAALNNRGNALLERGRPEEALASYEEALAISPSSAEVFNNRGNALLALGRAEEALASFERALALKPDYVEALNNHGHALYELGRPQEALESYSRALALRPDYAGAHWNEALCRLLLGDFAKGWQEYEWRWRDRLKEFQRDFAQPLWLGAESLEGKIVLLHAEQGFGDTIQFCRYAARVAALGATVILEVQPALKRLMEGLEGASRVLAHREPLPRFDLHCPLSSLPLAFGTRLDTIPAEVPYLRAMPELVAYWKQRLADVAGFRIGIAWRGSPGNPRDRERSFALSLFAGLGQVQGVRLASLQKEAGPDEVNSAPGAMRILHLGDELHDFADSAALVSSLDLVICADTALAHLAGALGVPVWVALPYAPDWRWLLEREDSPWYPSMRLFRQARLGDWAGVFARIEAALRNRTRPARAGASAAADASHALAALQSGRLEEAAERCHALLVDEPDNFDALHVLGIVEYQRARYEHAGAVLAGAVRANPRSAPARVNLGNALKRLGRTAEALAAYDQALALDPQMAEAHNNRGNLLQELGRAEDALECYDMALSIRPDYAEALNNRGNTLHALERHEEALASYARALAARPDYSDALVNRGNTLRRLRRPREALASYDAALSYRRDDPEALNARGLALMDLGRTSAALESYDAALALDARCADALNNRGLALQELGRYSDAIASFRAAIAARPDFPEAHWNQALCRLLTGDFALGWKEYEWRWKNQRLEPRRLDFSQPLWLGAEDLRGKTILVAAEQGLGDTIQFARYVPLLAARGATVVLEVLEPLKRLMTSLQGAHRVLARGEALPRTDYYCPLLSLPLAFGTTLETVPAMVPYLMVDASAANRWRARVEATRARLNVGLVWASQSAADLAPMKSLGLAQLAPLASAPGIVFWSLQKGAAAAEAQRPPDGMSVVDASGELEDFADTAALVSALDLVITVDTAVAHLAGALGKRVWTLVRTPPDWRWLLEREDSPWYPTMRLFRQTRTDDWGDVVPRVADALRESAKTQPKSVM